MEEAAVVVEATVNMVNRRGWNISFGRIIRRLVLRECDYYYYYYYYYYHHHHKKIISNVQYCLGLLPCTTGRT
jgi:hypothetical protein